MDLIEETLTAHHRIVRIDEVENMIALLGCHDLHEPTKTDYDSGQKEMYNKIFGMLNSRMENLETCGYFEV